MDTTGDNETFPPPYLPSDMDQRGGGGRGYALSGKIMLSAIIILFAVVLIMVCLHIYARFYILRAARRRRDIRRRRRTHHHLVFYIEPDNPSSIIPFPTRGLDASLLKSIPIFTYKKGELAAAGEENEKGEEVLECAVCLSEFEEGEKGRVLPKCNHSFHVECIDMWFHSHSTCPICRSSVDAPPSKSAEEEREGGDVVVEVAEEREGAESEERVEPSQQVLPRGSSSFGGRRKGLDLVGVSIEVPRRSQSFAFCNSDESGPSQGFKSPILSFKRILSREKRPSSPASLPSPACAVQSPAGASGYCSELDVELGRVEEGSVSQTVMTPR